MSEEFPVPPIVGSETQFGGSQVSQPAAAKPEASTFATPHEVALWNLGLLSVPRSRSRTGALSWEAVADAGQ